MTTASSAQDKNNALLEILSNDADFITAGSGKEPLPDDKRLVWEITRLDQLTGRLGGLPHRSIDLKKRNWTNHAILSDEQYDTACRRSRKVASHEFRLLDVWHPTVACGAVQRAGFLFDRLLRGDSAWAVPCPKHPESATLTPVLDGTLKRPLVTPHALAMLSGSQCNNLEDGAGLLMADADGLVWVEFLFLRDDAEDAQAINDAFSALNARFDAVQQGWSDLVKFARSRVNLDGVPDNDYRRMLVVDMPEASFENSSRQAWDLIRSRIRKLQGGPGDEPFPVWVEEFEAVLERPTLVKPPPWLSGRSAGFDNNAIDLRWRERAKHNLELRAIRTVHHCEPNWRANVSLFGKAPPPPSKPPAADRSLTAFDIIHACCLLLIYGSSDVIWQQQSGLVDAHERLARWMKDQAGRSDEVWDMYSKVDGSRDDGSGGVEALGWFEPKTRRVTLHLANIWALTARPVPNGLVEHWRRFAALTLKVLFHELHHAAEQIVLTDWDNALENINLRASNHRRYRMNGPSWSKNETLAQADALDRVAFLLHLSPTNNATYTRTRSCRYLTSYASRALREAPHRVQIQEYVEWIASSGPGMYALGNHFRRVQPMLKPVGQPWCKVGERHQGMLIPIARSNYCVGLGAWLVEELVHAGAGCPGSPAFAAVAFERIRNEHELCHRKTNVHLVTHGCQHQHRQPPEIVLFLAECARLNQLLQW